jgi:hypothetical protein
MSAREKDPRRRAETRQEDVKVMELYPQQGKVRILDTVLDVMPVPDEVSARRFIPKWESMKSSVCWDTPTVHLVRDMSVRLAGGIPSRSEGPTGVSKSFAVEVLAALTNRSYLRHNYSKDSDPGDTIGRFVPSDARLAVRFEELLADESLKEESKDLIEKAKREDRSLTIYESRKLAMHEGLPGLEDSKDWRWQNGTLTGSMAYGSIYGADEPNLSPGNVIERENSALEKRPMLRLVEHEGEVIRSLTPQEKSIVDNGGVVPGVISLDSHFWYNAAQNPWGIGGGRVEESEARRNRLQDRIVESLTKKEYEEYLHFLIHGDQPDVVWQNKRYRGEKNVPTQYRELEQIPNVDVLIPWLAGFQTDLQELADKGKIGSEKDIKGGSYVYSRRNMERFLDTLKGAKTALVDTTELFKTGDLVYNENWHDLVTEAIHQEYLAGMYKEDQEVITDLIKASGIEEHLGPSQNNPSVPDWVKKAEQKGIQVEASPGEWIISRTSATNFGIIMDEQRKDYTFTEDGDRISAKRQIKSIAELFHQREREQAVPEQVVFRSGEEV